jgi:hypothetical protein
MKKVFLAAVAVVAFSSFSAEADETINASFRSCEDQAFDAVANYYDSGGSDGFDAGLVFERAYNFCWFMRMMF